MTKDTPQTQLITRETLLKVLDENGRSINGGDAQYHLPNGRPGKWMPAIKGDLIPCENGYHLTTIANIFEWSGPTLWVAEARGQRIEDEADTKIVVAQVRLLRKVERWNDRVLRLFACRVAEDALKLVGNPDPRSVEAITVAHRYANGEATQQELAAAGAVAVARDAAWAAARDAAWDAARAAAWAAAEAAAWDAARAAAEAAQIELLLVYLNGVRDD